MSKVTVPEEVPCDTPGKLFVPKTVLIEFDHPEHGKDSWFSIQENDMNDNIMLWCSWSTGMEAYEHEDGIRAAKTIIKNVRKKHPEAKVTSNYEGWK